jgi:hypothetical protein
MLTPRSLVYTLVLATSFARPALADSFPNKFLPVTQANADSPSDISGQLPPGWLDDSSYRGAKVTVHYSRDQDPGSAKPSWQIDASAIDRGQAQAVRPDIAVTPDKVLRVKLRARSTSATPMLIGLRQSPARIDLYQKNPASGWVQESAHTQLPRWLDGQTVSLTNNWADYQINLRPVYADPAAQLVLALRQRGQIEIASITWSTEPAAKPAAPAAIISTAEAEAQRTASIRSALASKQSLSDLFDTTTITGAQIDESTVKKVIRVDASGKKTDTTSLAEGFQKAYDSLSQGVPTKLVLAAGIYREAAPRLDWSAEPARSTLFVVEGEGDVQWTGADVFPLSKWKNEGDGLYSHPWPHQFGNYAWRWDSNRSLVSQRMEMAFLNDRPLKPRILETYTTTGIGLRTPRDEKITHTYSGFRDPKTILRPGEFGVSERAENGQKIWVRVPPGTTLREDSIEVSVRQNLIRFVDKHNLVLRNLTVTRVANEPHRRAIHFASFGGPLSTNVLIDRCRFLWNSKTGFQIAGENWTVRDTEASYNGGSGLNTDGLKNAIWINNTTNFNNWRGHWGGDTGYATAAVKAHRTEGHLVLGHTSIGNADHGFWYDIDCKNIYMQDVTLVDNLNHGTLHWELAAGPFHGRRLLLANADRSFYIFNVGHARLEDSIITTAGLHSLPKSEQTFRFGGNDRIDAHAILSQSAFFKPVIELRGNILAVQPPFARGLIEWADMRDPDKETYHPYTYSGSGNTFWAPESRQAVTYNIRKGVATNDGSNQIDQGGTATALQGWIDTRESGSRIADPALVAPAQYDFRFTPLSPLASAAARYPQVVLTPQQIDALRNFIYGTWLEYDEPAFSTTQSANPPKP